MDTFVVVKDVTIDVKEIIENSASRTNIHSIEDTLDACTCTGN